jgi:hypothetical protein
MILLDVSSLLLYVRCCINNHLIGMYCSRWLVGLWCSMPLSPIFQLYRGSQLYWWKKQQVSKFTQIWVDIFIYWSNLVWTVLEYHWLATVRSPGTVVSSINKADFHDITEILVKVALNTINQPTILNSTYQLNDY